MQIDRIVIGTDFSERADAAFGQGLAVARRNGSQVTLLFSEPVPSLTPLNDWEMAVHDRVAKDTQTLQDLCDACKEQGVEASHVLSEELPEQAIVDTALSVDAQLVVVGSHGRTGFKRFLLGSVAERVARTSPRPVLVARPAEDVDKGYGRVLVATDFSAAAEAALDLALLLAADGATVDLLHAWTVPPSRYWNDALGERFAQAGEEIVRRASLMGEQLVERHREHSATITFHLMEGSPKHCIQEWLENGAYDLVTVGSHGERGFRQWLLGNVAAATVRHSPCSVLVVPAARPQDSAED